VGFEFSATVRVNWDKAGLILKAPLATYRVQLNRGFGFSDLKSVVPYLADLGVSHIYASPIFKARAGSTHGYDVVDPNVINEELGGKTAFEELINEASVYGLGWIQDIVPNHAAYSLENKRVVDIMQNGIQSRFSRFFDVDWNHPSHQLNGRILTPFLGKELADCLKQKELTLAFDKEGFKICYGDLEFPLNNSSIQELLQEDDLKGVVKQINYNPAALTSLLSKQFYALTYWRNAFKEINYRRFFDLLDLIGVQVEEPTVFEETHRLIFELLFNGKVSGLRVDHVDGLYNPEEYLQTLRSKNPEIYILIEKILLDNEDLPDSWPIQGSTGYDFVNQINGLFIKQTNEAAIDQIYKWFTDNTQAFGELLFECKNLVIETYFWGDINNLARLISQTMLKLGDNQFDPAKMPNAIATLIACFPVYRTYLNPKSPFNKKRLPHCGVKAGKRT